MKKMFKKWMASLLTVVMICGLVTTNSFAIETRANEFSMTLELTDPQSSPWTHARNWNATVIGDGLYSGTLTFVTAGGGSLDATNYYNMALTNTPQDGFDFGQTIFVQSQGNDFVAVKIKITEKNATEIQNYVHNMKLKADRPINAYVNKDIVGTVNGETFTSFTGTFTPNQHVEIQQAPTPEGVKELNVTSDSITLTDATNANNGVYGNTEYSWDNGQTWTTEKTKTGLEANTEYTVLVRFAGKDNYTVSNNATVKVKTAKKGVDQLESYLKTIKPVDKTIAYEDGLTLADKDLAQAHGWTWKNPTTALTSVDKKAYDVVLDTTKLEETYDFTGLTEYTYDAATHTLTTQVNVEVTKGKNPVAIVAPTVKNVTATSIELENLKLGQEYSIDGKNWVPHDKAAAFIGLKQNTPYTIKTRIPANDYYNEVVGKDVKATTLSTIHGTVTGYDMPATLTIKVGNEIKKATINKTGDTYSFELPAGDYVIDVIGKDELQATTVVETVAGVKKVDIEMQDTFKGQAKKIVDENLIDPDTGTPITGISTNNVGLILDFEDEWNDLSNNVKDEINKLTAPKTYDELLAEAKKFIDEEADKFISEITDPTTGLIVDPTVGIGIDEIIGSIDEWEKLPEDVKKVIDEKLAPQTFEELVEEAKKYIDDRADKFISEIKDPTTGLVFDPTIGQGIDEIIGAEDEWKNLPEEVKKTIDERIAPKTYEELLAEAKKFVDESSDKFIKTYVSDDKGNIHKDVTKDNLDQILSGEDEWNSKTQSEKDAINKKLVSEGGKTYEELLALAHKMIDQTTDSFIKKYVSDKDGNIYKTATKDNYAQILSGKDTWDSLTQAQKDAINAKLLANGGKTYEELLKLAADIEAQLKAENNKGNGVQTDDQANVNMFVSMAGVSGLFIALLAVLKKKENISE